MPILSIFRMEEDDPHRENADWLEETMSKSNKPRQNSIMFFSAEDGKNVISAEAMKLMFRLRTVLTATNDGEDKDWESVCHREKVFNLSQGAGPTRAFPEEVCPAVNNAPTVCMESNLVGRYVHW